MAYLFGGNDQWNDVRKALIGDGHMIELNDGAYIVGVESKHYGRSPRWSDSITSWVDCRDAKLLGKLHSWECERPIREDWLPVHHWLEDMLKMLTVGVDAIDPSIRDTGHVRWVVDQIRAKSPRATVCPYRRFHSLVTNMDRRVRQALRFDGQELVEMDVAGSQPLLLAFLARCDSTGSFIVKDQIKYGAKMSKKVCFQKKPTSKTTPPTTHQPPPNQLTTILCPYFSETHSESLIDEPEPVPDDLERFTVICEEGDVYEHLGAIWGWDARNPEGRRRVKQEVFHTLLFGRIPSPKRENYGQWVEFSAEYPSLAHYLRDMKYTAKDHGVVARVAQRVESWIMIERICGRIKDEIPGVAIATVHDSILVGRPHAPSVEAIMREEFAALGISPTIKTK
jgi:hypothetical protein